MVALGAPETAHAEYRLLEARGIGPLERLVQDEMLPRGRDRRRAAGQRLGRGRHFELFLEHEHGGVSRGRGLNIGRAAAMRTSRVPARASHHLTRRAVPTEGTQAVQY